MIQALAGDTQAMIHYPAEDTIRLQMIVQVMTEAPFYLNYWHIQTPKCLVYSKYGICQFLKTGR